MLAEWFDKFMAQAVLINMNEYFCGQVDFILHPLCDASYHITHIQTGFPFEMKHLLKNASYLEHVSPSNMVSKSTNMIYCDKKTKIYVSRDQLVVINYITSYTGQILKDLMMVPGNTSFMRLLTVD